MKNHEQTPAQRQATYDTILKSIRKIDDMYAIPFDGLFIYWPFLFDTRCSKVSQKALGQILDDNLLFRETSDIHPDLESKHVLYDFSSSEVLKTISAKYLFSIDMYRTHMDKLDASLIEAPNLVDEELAIVSMIEGATVHFTTANHPRHVVGHLPSMQFMLPPDHLPAPRDADMLCYMERWGGFDTDKPLSMVSASFYEVYHDRFKHRPLAFTGKFSKEFFAAHKELAAVSELKLSDTVSEVVVNQDDDINNYNVQPEIYLQHSELTAEHLFNYVSNMDKTGQDLETLRHSSKLNYLKIEYVNQDLVENYPVVAHAIAASLGETLPLVLLCKLLHSYNGHMSYKLLIHPELDDRMIDRYADCLDVRKMVQDSNIPTSAVLKLKLETLIPVNDALLISRAIPENNLRHWFERASNYMHVSTVYQLVENILETQSITTAFRGELLAYLVKSSKLVSHGFGGEIDTDKNTICRMFRVGKEGEEGYVCDVIEMDINKPVILHRKERVSFNHNWHNVSPGLTEKDLNDYYIKKHPQVDKQLLREAIYVTVFDMREYSAYIHGCDIDF